MVFTVYGVHWRKMRRIMTVPFFTNMVVQQYRHGWEDEVVRVVEDVRKNPEAAMNGIVLRRRLQVMMNNNMYRIMFDRGFESEDDPFLCLLSSRLWMERGVDWHRALITTMVILSPF